MRVMIVDGNEIGEGRLAECSCFEDGVDVSRVGMVRTRCWRARPFSLTLFCKTSNYLKCQG